MMQLATVDDWYQLSEAFPEFRKVGMTCLKDWGYMKACNYIDQRFAGRPPDKGIRILEFGHGFNPYLLSRYQSQFEVWGADRAQGLAYFDDRTWEQRFRNEVGIRCPNVRFVKILVGEREPSREELPADYFDLIVSVSVLEEMPVAQAGKIVAAASKLLRKGGVLIGSYDLLLSNYSAITTEYYYEHRKAGLDIAIPPPGLLDWSSVLVENPPAVMLWYAGALPEKGREYWGHHGSLFTVGAKEGY
jgi:SAM-dependent methyltransferase